MAMQNCFWRRMRYEKAIGLKLMPIPFQLLQAFLLSQLVLLATDGEVRKVGFYGGILLGLLVFYHGISMVLKMKYKKEKRIEIQIAKLSFYQSYLRLPLEKLYHSSVGEDLEHFTHDCGSCCGGFDFRRVSFLSESYDGGSSSGDRDGTDRSAVDCQKVYAG